MYNVFFKKYSYILHISMTYFYSGHQSEDLYDFNTHLFSVAHR